MREQIGKLLRCRYGWWTEETMSEILTLFKEQIEKMEVLSDEEIDVVYRTSPVMGIKLWRAMSQAQLAKCKDALRGCE